MRFYSWIIIIAIAVILVATKLLLEHQKDVDRANGCEQDNELYTMKGMLKQMKEDRKLKKAEEREKRNNIRKRVMNSDNEKRGHISVASFKDDQK